MMESVPSDWIVSTLGTCCSIASGGTPRRERPEYWGGSIPWVTPKDISNLDSPDFFEPAEKITELGLRKSSAALLPAGAVLMSSRAPIGLLAIAGQPMATNQGFKSLIPGPELDGRFLYYAIRRLVPVIQERGNGATFKEVSKSVVSEIPVSYPRSLEQQRRIAAILDKADEVRRKRERALAMADELLKSVFLEMFDDPSTNPMAWPTATLDELGEVQGGLQVTKTRDSLNLRLPYLRVANVYRDRLDLGEIKQIGVTPAEFERTKLAAGDILIVEGHGNPEEIGRAAVWDGSIDPCLHQNHLIRFRADRSQVIALYVSRVLNSTGGRLQLIGAGRTTSGLNTISTRKVKEVWIPVPPLATQQKFENFASREQMLQRSLYDDHVYSNNLFVSLFQRAFRGEL